mgnify:CR=1 FL=1
MQHGAEFDATDVEGRSPLHYAYSERHAKATLLSMYMQYTTGGQGASVSVRESATKLMGSLSSSINNPMMIHMDSDMEDQVQLYPCLQLYVHVVTCAKCMWSLCTERVRVPGRQPTRAVRKAA